MKGMIVLNKKMGRPETPAYRKKSLRFSRVEDVFTKNLDKLESENDKKLVLELLEEIKGKVV
jgi:hypothetical protein